MTLFTGQVTRKQLIESLMELGTDDTVVVVNSGSKVDQFQSRKIEQVTTTRIVPVKNTFIPGLLFTDSSEEGSISAIEII